MPDLKKQFNLKREPFEKDIPVKDLYLTSSHKEVLSRLKYAAKEQKFVVFTADCGMGKTTLLRALKQQLNPKQYEFFYLTDSNLTPMLMYRNMLAQLGLEARYYRGDSKELLHIQLENLKKTQGKLVVVVIDEGHLLSKKMIEEVRFLLNYKMDSYSPMALILVGQNELRDKLYKEQYAAVRQRINMICKLDYFTRKETEEYISSHLKSAGAKNILFSESSLDLIYKKSNGIARNINNICSLCLLNLASIDAKTVDTSIVNNIIELEML
ncbi:MAG: AAA family ATPase [Sphaerochaetaceae bacterium]|nr:AAA family ATPase [Sphaerochaetaceae bacterium]